MSALPFVPTAERLLVVVASYAFLLATSGFVVTRSLRTVPSDDDVPTGRERAVGVLVGKCENVLTLTFVLAGAYTALAVVFAAKGIVRKDDIEKNSLFYLAGTLVNLTYSVLVGLAAAVLVTVL
ncbi:hypothetical protein [Halobacterium noricense]|uniref:hypothetical protein n=1 Tax=Halobacterium noricense TaxID=223182 RepID=UPI001E5311CE|nr:hypothetical protein [Halobacterium noricense]UHH26265.1 hypothetical protein LT974_04840 [Halobacterium noricense]